jgi:hypothetical protein
VDFNFAVVINKTQFPKSVHEKAHARSRRADHLRQGLLADFRYDWLRPTFLAFWDQAHERLARLGNRLGKDGRTKILDELRPKVPPVTEAEREAGDGKEKFAEYVAILLKAGWSTADIRMAMRLAQLSDDEFDETVAETVRGYEVHRGRPSTRSSSAAARHRDNRCHVTGFRIDATHRRGCFCPPSPEVYVSSSWRWRV